MEKELEGKITFLDVQIERQGNSDTDFCLPQEYTHRQIPRLHLPPPCQGAPRSCAVSEGQSWEGMWRRKAMGGDPAPQTSVQSQRLSRTCSEEQPERQTDTIQHHAPSPSLYQRSDQTNWEDVPTTGSENSDEDGGHSQKPTGEVEAWLTARRRVWSTQARIPCKDCHCVYIGETGRTLEKHLSEHKAAVKKNEPKNGIAGHAWANQHQVNWEATSVKQEERSYWRRRVLEALHIHQQHRTLNLDCELNINAAWLPLLDKPPFPKCPPWPLTKTPTLMFPPTLFFAIIQFIHSLNYN